MIQKQFQNDATFNIVDEETVDFDCPGSEWSSVEVLVFDGVDNEHSPVFRLHQDCLYNKRHYAYKKRPAAANPIPGTPEQLEVISYFTNLLDIDRPEAWHWEGWQYADDYPYEDEDPMPTGQAYRDFAWGLKTETLNKRYLGFGYRFPMFFQFEDSELIQLEENADEEL